MLCGAGLCGRSVLCAGITVAVVVICKKEWNMVSIFQKYMGTGLMLIWFVLALVYLFCHEKRKPYRILFLYMPVMVLLVFFNPLFFRLFSETVGGEIYFRLCWLLPVILVIGYTITLICDSLKGRQKAYFGLVAIMVLMISGKLVYSSPLFSRAENTYHIPQVVVDICDAIEVEGREVMAAFPDEFLLYVRQYSPVICMPYGRESFEYYNELNAVIMSEEPDAEGLAALAMQNHCHYVIIQAGKVLLEDMIPFDFELFASIDGYEIYKNNNMYFGL